jgi:5'(3')-deoxyribonucleotidase
MKTLACDIDGVLAKSQFDFNSSEEKLLTTPITQGSQEALQTLKKDFQIHLVTSRPVSVKMPTVHWTFQYFGIKSVAFVSEKTPQTTDSDILIDDRLENIEKFIVAGGSGILFLGPWSGTGNKVSKDLMKQAEQDKRFFVANGWEGVLSTVKKVKA